MEAEQEKFTTTEEKSPLAKSRSVEERVTDLEKKLLKISQVIDSNTEVMLGGMQTVDVRLAMLFLIVEDLMNAKVHTSPKDISRMDLDHYAKRAEEALKASDAEQKSVESATEEDVAVYFGGNQ